MIVDKKFGEEQQRWHLSSRHAVSCNVSLFSVYGAEFNWVKFWHTIMLSRTKPWDVYDRFRILIILFCLWKKYRTWIAYQRFCLAVILFCHWKNYKTWDVCQRFLLVIILSCHSKEYNTQMVYQIFLKAIILFCHSKKYITACMSKISFNNNSILSLKEVQNIDGPFKISCSNYSVFILFLFCHSKKYTTWYMEDFF